ncbi:hypothetical protein FHS21_002792 [Phyllobacterium trifolii]|uniref:Uncharacterized protein n=1 Tax=Phyllobacterium trifolii TaxID=300193 RepID=A0A839U791_9HYPH|nr:hypothetical protein [Phyllobacterium trifolii]
MRVQDFILNKRRLLFLWIGVDNLRIIDLLQTILPTATESDLISARNRRYGNLPIMTHSTHTVFASAWFATSKPHYCAGKATAANGGFEAKSNSHKTAAMFHNIDYAIFECSRVDSISKCDTVRCIRGLFLAGGKRAIFSPRSYWVGLQPPDE